MHVVVQISTAFLVGDEELVNLPISLGAADLYHALETMILQRDTNAWQGGGGMM